MKSRINGREKDVKEEEACYQEQQQKITRPLNNFLNSRRLKLICSGKISNSTFPDCLKV
jgi:hypothetical protein